MEELEYTPKQAPPPFIESPAPPVECRPPAATAFIVTFDSNSTEPTTNKMAIGGGTFVKKHNRNFSLPVVKVYENNVGSVVNGKTKKPGNYSEGYFSSDPDEENENKHMTSPKEEENFDKLVNVGSPVPDESAEDNASDVGSETGTYTVDKESPEVVTARLSIDATFGINPNMTSSRESASWINEWASNAAENTCVGFKGSISSHSSHSKVSKTKISSSKIPSPVVSRAKSSDKVQKSDSLKSKNGNGSNGSSIHCEDTNNAYETESYLKTTEKTLSLMAARMSVSLDSGGESDGDSFAGKHTGRPMTSVNRSDSSASESAKTTSASARFNRALNLRRSRLDENARPPSNSRPSSAKTENSGRSSSTVRSKANTPLTPAGPPVLSRLDNTRLSLRAKPSAQTQIQKTDPTKKKFPNGGGSIQASGGRSNSTLTSKEVEFQNWKRRKSYDPMKAAAEGKKMQVAATKKPPMPLASGSSSLTQSTCNALPTPKSPVTSVLRSASFHGHGTRQLAGRSSSDDEDEEEVILSAEEEEWPVLQAPKTSLENTPRGSRVSLHSNNSNSPRARHKLEGVDNLVVSAISGLSGKLKVNLGGLLRKLRYLYDEESEKYHQLSIEIEQLEMPESSTSPQKSSSRELALTLKNLKRLDTTVKDEN